MIHWLRWQNFLNIRITNYNTYSNTQFEVEKKYEGKIMQSRLFFCSSYFSVISRHTRVNQNFFGFNLTPFGLYWPFRCWILSFNPLFWWLFNNFEDDSCSNDFKSTKRRSMKNIFTNTNENSLSWPNSWLTQYMKLATLLLSRISSMR